MIKFIKTLGVGSLITVALLILAALVVLIFACLVFVLKYYTIATLVSLFIIFSFMMGKIFMESID